jgi:hypothetical protein
MAWRRTQAGQDRIRSLCLHKDDAGELFIPPRLDQRQLVSLRDQGFHFGLDVSHSFFNTHFVGPGQGHVACVDFV